MSGLNYATLSELTDFLVAFAVKISNGMARLWPRRANGKLIGSAVSFSPPFAVKRRLTIPHCCRHTGSPAWGHIGHTSHHSIWHASNIFATCVGAYRDSGGGDVENRAGDHERSACCTYTHYNARWCAVIDERDMHPPREHHFSVSLSRKLPF